MNNERHPIPWGKYVAIATLCGFAYAGATWAYNQIGGIQEKRAHNDTSYVVVMRLEPKVQQLSWKEKRDSSDIRTIKTKLHLP